MYNNITISGRICTGKSTLFSMLSQELQWETISSSQYFRNYARDHAFDLNKAEEQNSALTKKIDYMVRDKLRAGKHIIAEGWMAGVMAEKNKSVLKVLLTSSDEIRFKRFSEREHISFEAAKPKIHERESSLLKKLSDIYDINDIFDPNRYNIVIDTSAKTPHEVMQIVLHEIHPNIH